MIEQVLVLGAGGCVGQAALTAIRAHPGLRGIAGLHRGRAEPDTRLADATDARALTAALDGCTLAVNAVGGSPATLLASTRALCIAARSAGVRRVVHVSSMAVYGGQASGTIDEAAPLATDPSPYEAAKIGCESHVEAFVAAGGQAVSLRPGLVFGPASAQWAHRIARLLRARRLGDLGPSGDGFCNLTYEPDLGAGIVAALLHPHAAGPINLATACPLTWNGFFGAFARALGATPVGRLTARRLRLEALAAPLLQVAKVATRQLSPAWLPDPVPRSLIRLFGQRMRLDPGLADRLLGIVRTPDGDAIRATAAGVMSSPPLCRGRAA